MNGTVFAATMTPVTAGVGAFTSLLPDIRKVRTATHADTDVKHDLRTGEIAACVIVIGLGVLSSYFAKSKLPLIVALIVSVGLVVMYETILIVTPPERKPA